MTLSRSQTHVLPLPRLGQCRDQPLCWPATPHGLCWWSSPVQVQHLQEDKALEEQRGSEKKKGITEEVFDKF